MLEMVSKEILEQQDNSCSKFRYNIHEKEKQPLDPVWNRPFCGLEMVGYACIRVYRHQRRRGHFLQGQGGEKNAKCESEVVIVCKFF